MIKERKHLSFLELWFFRRYCDSCIFIHFSIIKINRLFVVCLTCSIKYFIHDSFTAVAIFNIYLNIIGTRVVCLNSSRKYLINFQYENELGSVGSRKKASTSSGKLRYIRWRKFRSAKGYILSPRKSCNKDSVMHVREHGECEKSRRGIDTYLHIPIGRGCVLINPAQLNEIFKSRLSAGFVKSSYHIFIP